MKTINLEKQRRVKRHERFLDIMDRKGLIALDDLSTKQVRSLKKLLEAFCEVCNESGEMEGQFGEVADALQTVVDFFRDHQRILKEL